jgi:ketosteroid isomerase-like protein
MNAKVDTRKEQIEADTRRVALALYEGMEDVQVMDSLIAPDADLWVNGAGKLDRKEFVAVHKAYTDRPPPTSRRTALHGLIVDGERAAIEMEWEISWPDITYHQYYHHVLIVRQGKIASMRMYQDMAEGARFFFADQKQ